LQGLRVFTLLSTTGIFVALSCASLVGQCHVSGFWIRLPKRVSQRLVSFAALLYWGLGWLVPLAGYLIAAFQQPPLSRAEQALVVGLTGLLAASAYALLIEPRWVVARNLVLPYAGLPTPLDGLRILHLSDLHFPLPRPTVRRMRHLIRQLSPDLICVTGDLANDARSDSGHGLLQCRQFLGSLTPPRGMFLVWGDWDGVAKGWREFEQAISTDRQVFILNDALRRIWVHQTPVVIMGRAPAHLDAQTNYMRQLPREGFRIVLHHYPFGALRAAELGVDL
jgi:predicted MPP superfamily phosphohydrolase